MKKFFIGIKKKFLNFLRRCAGSLKVFYSDYRGYILTVFTLASLALSVFYFRYSEQRIYESIIDLGKSVVIYFGSIYGFEVETAPTVTEFSKYDITECIQLPFTWEEFKELWVRYWQTWATWENVGLYFSWFGDFLFYVSQILLVVSPLFILLALLLSHCLSRQNNDYNADSRVMKLHRKFTYKVLSPVRAWFFDFFDFVKYHSFWWKTFLLIWIYNFNFLSVGLEFFAFYVYFIAAFDFGNIYVQVVKLLIDLSVVIFTVPVWSWLIIGCAVWEFVSIKAGYNNLQHCERKNRGFINERSLITFVCGTMGSGKTTAITDMALSANVQFHDDAFKILLDIDFEFFRFPWQNFQQWLKKKISKHEIYSPYTCKEPIRIVRHWLDLAKKYPESGKAIRRHLKKEYGYNYGLNPWDYDVEHYGGTYWNGVMEVDLWKALEDYAQAYFVYVTTTFILSNYSIRLDERLIDFGNFPVWDSNFFRKERRRINKSHHAHILDYDMLRLGKKIVANNPNFYAFGVGVYVISEIDKERQNALSLQEVKASATECNQKNDMFNELLKMSRHATVIRNVPFIRFFVDAQRPEDWGANARETAEVVHIAERCEARVLLPWFSPWRLFEFIFDFVYGKISDLYVDFSVNRGDNSFLIWALKWIGAKFKSHYERTYNKFGCAVLKLNLESGKLDGDLQPKKYYLNFQKIYKDRFNTAAMSGFFAKIARHAEIGLNDLLEYGDTTATDEELKKTNSLFFRRIEKYSDMVEKNK